MGLLDFLRNRAGAGSASSSDSGRTPEEERSGERDQRTLDSASAEDVVDPSRVPGEGDELDRPPRSQ